MRQRLCTHTAQSGNRIGQCELLAGQPGDETPAADFATRFQPLVHAQQFAPWRQPRRFAFEQPPAHHAIATQQRARHVFEGVLMALAGFGTRQFGQRTHWGPAAGVANAQRTGTATVTRQRRRPLGRRHQQRAQAGIAVAMRTAAHQQLAQCIFQLGGHQMRPVCNFFEEQRALLMQHLHDMFGAGPQRCLVCVTRQRAPALRCAPWQQHDRRAAQCGAAPPTTGSHACPQRAPGGAQLVQPGRLIVVHTRRQQLAFPQHRRRLEAFELSHHAGQCIRPRYAAAAVHALPFEQKARVIALRHRLDRAAPSSQRVTMETCQQVTLAPFFRLRVRTELPCHDIALALQARQCERDLCLWYPQRVGQGRHLRGAEVRQAPSQSFAHCPIALPVGNVAIVWRLQGRLRSGLRIQRQKPVDALGTEPQRGDDLQGNA
ncbi:hypothetical protein B4599_13965 [Xanthomonas oryzae pv. oryzae]|nr:hypothetical protein B9W05_08580 [Xanthomonas oryzae pv. oryzae]AXX67732.1 hypothetical protein B4599_13965 [Xanthomonas oryzae pv. oryzae]UMA61070.1 hypothetical protein BXU04_14450 [Xanthomonas oryzae pv. oryzae]UWZ69515.1 hypothetical protein BHL62_14585 [Xanthomonas oryzae pv. oryzae]